MEMSSGVHCNICPIGHAFQSTNSYESLLSNYKNSGLNGRCD